MIRWDVSIESSGIYNMDVYIIYIIYDTQYNIGYIAVYAGGESERERGLNKFDKMFACVHKLR